MFSTARLAVIAMTLLSVMSARAGEREAPEAEKQLWLQHLEQAGMHPSLRRAFLRANELGVASHCAVADDPGGEVKAPPPETFQPWVLGFRLRTAWGLYVLKMNEGTDGVDAVATILQTHGKRCWADKGPHAYLQSGRYWLYLHSSCGPSETEWRSAVGELSTSLAKAGVELSPRFVYGMCGGKDQHIADTASLGQLRIRSPRTKRR